MSAADRDPDHLDLFAPDAVDDPYPLYDRLRRRAPVHRVDGTRVHLVSTWDLVVEAAERTEDFSSHLTGILVRGAGGDPDGVGVLDVSLGGAVEQVLATADGVDHQAHRTFVLRALGRRIRVLEAAIGELVERCWDEGADGGVVGGVDGGVDETGVGRIDWAHAVADRLPPSVLAILLGIPDDEVPRLLTSAYESVELLSGLVPPERMDGLLASTAELLTYLEGKVVAGPDGAGDGLIGVLAAAHADGEIELATAAMMLVQLVGAGAETTAGLIGTAARRLGEDLALQHRLRAEPDLVDAFLDECLRLECPLRGHYREVARDTTLGGVPLAAGDHLLLLWSAANRDPGRFDRPDELDLDRPSVRGHVAFGKGRHFCVGSSLARMEATAAVRLLLRRTSWVGLAPDVEPTWIPSIVVRRHARLELAFTPS